jgi:putative intracellular protease/amidase
MLRALVPTVLVVVLIALPAAAIAQPGPPGGVSSTKPEGAERDDRSGETVRAPHALIVLTNHGELGDTGKPTGFYLSEAAHPWEVFREAGFKITLASPAGGPAPADPRSLDLDDPANRAFADRYLTDGVVPGTVPLGEVDPSQFVVIFFAGGHGTMWDFATHPDVARVGDAIYAGGGVVGAVCHGPAALLQLSTPGGRPLVAGRQITSFTNAEEDAVELTAAMPFLLETRLRELGARFHGGDDFTRTVSRDGRVVTGQNPASATATAERIVEAVREMGLLP